jgi:hypothetical protein
VRDRVTSFKKQGSKGYGYQLPERGEYGIGLPTSRNRGVRDRVTNFQKQGSKGYQLPKTGE